jgi:signal transduction histidine kinase
MTPDSRLETWEGREGTAMAVVPYFLLAVSTALMTAKPDQSGREIITNLILAGAIAALMLCMITLHPQWRPRVRLMTAYFVALLALTATLVIRTPWFGFFAFAGYLHAYFVLPRRLLLYGVAAVAVIAATAQYGGVPGTQWSHVSVYLILVVINVSLACGVSWFASVDDAQHERRRRTVTDLQEANRRLEESLAENEALHAQLLASAREAGVRAERERLAREIHDTVAQGLAGIITQLQAADDDGPTGANWQRHVDTATQLARESLSEARRSVQALGPEALETSRLPEALASMAERWSRSHEVVTDVTVTGTTEPLRPEIEVTLLRTAQEALTNAAKHADAKRVGITLSYMGDVVTLDVRDDGVGFDPENVAAADAGDRLSGFGLMAMRQRVEGMAGTLEVESEPGGGTAVSASVPAIGGAGISRPVVREAAPR